MDRPIYTLPIPKDAVSKLKKLNITCTKDIKCNSVNETATLLQDPTFADEFSRYLTIPNTRNALYYLEQEEKKTTFTFCKAIDELLGGGFKVQNLIELVGQPGSGKTQLCLQLCEAAKIPLCLGGSESDCIYIDINNNYSQKRVDDLHAFYVEQCKRISENLKLTENEKVSLQKYNQGTSRKTFKYIVNDVFELKSSLYLIRNKLLPEKSLNIRLIVIDSFASAFNLVTSGLQRTRILSSILNRLNEFAFKHNILIVLTNSLVTHIKDDKEFEVVPGFGETFSHQVHERLILSRFDNNVYAAELTKSSENKYKRVYFKITNAGIKDVQD